MDKQPLSQRRRNSRFVWLVATTSLLVLPNVIGSQDQQVAANGLVSEIAISQFEEVRDFGDVTQGQILTAKFPITNVGHRRLVLNQLGSSCECAHGDRGTIILQPGEST